MDWASPHTVGGLKWITVDLGVIIGGRGLCQMTHEFENCRVQHDEKVGSLGPWSTEKTGC